MSSSRQRYASGMSLRSVIYESNEDWENALRAAEKLAADFGRFEGALGDVYKRQVFFASWIKRMISSAFMDFPLLECR